MATGGKGGSSSSGSSTNYGTATTSLPSWLDAASQQAISQAEALGTKQYTPYLGQIVADPTAATQQSYADVSALQGGTTPAYNAATGAWGGVLGNLQSLTPDQQNAMTSQLYGNYAGNVVSPTASLLSPYMQQGPATAQQVGSNAMTLMSPYEQAVLDPAMKLGSQALAQNLQTVGAGANQAGAFGGTRQGVMEGVAQGQAALNLSQYAGNLLASGYNAALNPAANVALQGGQQGYGAATGLGNLMQQGYAPAAQQGQQMATTNLGLGTSAAQQLPQLATNQQTALQQQASLLSAVGAAQQNQQQTELNAQLGQFYEAQQQPYTNLDTLLAAVGGTPYGTTTSGYSTGTTSGTTSNWNAKLNLLGFL